MSALDVMKIQEMRSGILHLTKRLEDERRDNILELPRLDEAAAKPILQSAPDSELSEARWSVISFERREAGSLTYSRAVTLLLQLDADRVAGLCIVTDEAADRIRR
ncbi:MAG: hypothetical protein ABJB40_03705 [Acidobacteriota bacterium]